MAQAKWTREQIQQHIEAARRLDQIKNEAFAFLKVHPHSTEYAAQQFILERFRTRKLRTDKDPPIVAFRENTAHVHYYPPKSGSFRLRPNSLILLDIWARLNEPRAPFADATWMAYKGEKIPNEIQEIFDVVVRARDACLALIGNVLEHGQLPDGQAVDAVARNIIARAGHKKHFPHSVGHSLGFTSPHGIWGALRRTNHQPISENLGYTIEPAIYLTKNFGVRSEINFYIDQKKSLVITTGLQKELVRL